jgi:hypothetical protein
VGGLGGRAAAWADRSSRSLGAVGSREGEGAVMKYPGNTVLITQGHITSASELMRVRALYAAGTLESGILRERARFKLNRPRGRTRTYQHISPHDRSH